MNQLINQQTNQLTVAVITATIGRDELERTIESIKNQSYPCKHYIFVDGEDFRYKAKTILDKYPDVIPIYLPMNTGKNQMFNSSINAIAPFLVSEDIICYLDDDNWVRKDHIESLVHEIALGADFAYSLRAFYLSDGRFICLDDLESLGYWSAKGFIRFDLKIGERSKVLEYNLNNFQSFIDVNCYAIPREIAFELPKAWYSGWGNDRRVYQKLSELGLKGRGTGRYTVNYQIDFEKFFNLETFLSEYSLSDELKNQLGEAILKNMCLKNIEMHDYKKTWAKE